jgi:hypothetical protein
MSKTLFFKWQLPFLTLDINVKFNFKATFINIVYAYFQPFWRNLYFLNKIFFFFIKQLFYLNFYSKITAINSRFVSVIPIMTRLTEKERMDILLMVGYG